MKYAAPMTTTSSALSFFPPLSSRAAFSAGAPLPQVEEEEDIKAMPRPSTPTSKSKPSGFALNGALPPPLGRAPTAATAAFALASSSRPSACDRVDLATKLLDANHAMSTPTYTREYLVREWRKEKERRTKRRRVALCVSPLTTTTSSTTVARVRPRLFFFILISPSLSLSLSLFLAWREISCLGVRVYIGAGRSQALACLPRRKNSPPLPPRKNFSPFLFLQESVRPTHLKPESFRQKLAYAGIQLVRRTFDFVTGYNPHGPNPESRWLRRMLFLETVAGVPGEEFFSSFLFLFLSFPFLFFSFFPFLSFSFTLLSFSLLFFSFIFSSFRGVSRLRFRRRRKTHSPLHLFFSSSPFTPSGMVGGSLRHLRSLRMLRYDGGRINTLLDESENERMHLMTFLELGERKGPLFRAAVVAAQGIMWNLFFLLYLASPNTGEFCRGCGEKAGGGGWTEKEKLKKEKCLPSLSPSSPPQSWQGRSGRVERHRSLLVSSLPFRSLPLKPRPTTKKKKKKTSQLTPSSASSKKRRSKLIRTHSPRSTRAASGPSTAPSSLPRSR